VVSRVGGRAKHDRYQRTSRPRCDNARGQERQGRLDHARFKWGIAGYGIRSAHFDKCHARVRAGIRWNMLRSGKFSCVDLHDHGPDHRFELVLQGSCNQRGLHQRGKFSELANRDSLGGCPTSVKIDELDAFQSSEPRLHHRDGLGVLVYQDEVATER
jgi:hypothetical protein